MVDAREYHQRTKHTPESVRSTPGLAWDNKPIPYTIYEDRPSVALADAIRPVPVPTLRAIADATGAGDRSTPDHDALTQICWLSAGITKTIRRGDREHAFRAAACTGALYHVDLYLVSGALESLDPGVYHFDPRTLSLDRIRSGEYRGVLADATGDHPRVAAAPVSIVLTSTWWRNAWKYRERTYRHAFWDSGTILANLLAVARSLDLPTGVVTGFVDETVADLLGIDPDQHAPLAVVPVGADEAVPSGRAIEPVDHPTRRLSPNPREFPLIQEAYTQSTLADGGAVRAWREARSNGPIAPREHGSGSRRDLDPVGDSRASKVPLHHTIRRRGSCRAFRHESLNYRKVSTVLDRATRGVPLDAVPSRPLAITESYLIVHSVEGLDSGTYQYHPGDGELERLRTGEFHREAGHLALDQRLAADAGLCVYLLADLDSVVDDLGNRGYRVAQLEAAVTAGRLYLATYAHRDLGATGLTFYDDLVTDFFEPRAAGRTPMFLLAIGRPA